MDTLRYFEVLLGTFGYLEDLLGTLRYFWVPLGTFGYRLFFLLVLPPKVPSVENGKIPTKRVKVDLSNSKI